MGNELIAVSDAGPLIHLAEIDRLTFLSTFGLLHIPNAVWQETIEQGRTSRSELLALGNVQRHISVENQVSRFVVQSGLKELHAGERECLYLCQELEISLVLTDDLAVREAARDLGVRPVGSLGVIIRACRAGHIPPSEAKQCVLDLYDVSSLYVTRAIVEIAIEQLDLKIKGET